MTGDQPLPAELVPQPKRVKLTKARRAALEVLAERHSIGRCARVSNVTDPGAGYVHWQSFRWLSEAGLAAGIDDGRGGESSVYVRITAAGLIALDQHG